MAPLLAQSLGNEDRQWTEICTVAGTKWVKDQPAGSTGSGTPVGSKHGADAHCVFCFATTPPDTLDASRHLAPPASTFVRLQASDDVFASFSGHHIRSRAPPL